MDTAGLHMQPCNHHATPRAMLVAACSAIACTAARPTLLIEGGSAPMELAFAPHCPLALGLDRFVGTAIDRRQLGPASFSSLLYSPTLHPAAKMNAATPPAIATRNGLGLVVRAPHLHSTTQVAHPDCALQGQAWRTDGHHTDGRSSRGGQHSCGPASVARPGYCPFVVGE